MAKSNKNANTIVAINKATQNVFGLSGNEIFPFDFNRGGKGKGTTYISYIPFKNIITTTVEISHTVEEADLLDAIVIKVYEELGLDAALDYKITYLEVVGSTSENRVFNVFVVDSQILTSDFDAIAARTGYIDYVAMAPFLYESLYARGLLSKETVDCFIYLQRDDAFLVVYQNGEYLQSRQIRYNLKYIHDKFSELIGNRLEEETFDHMLSTYGLNLDTPAERDYIIQIFDEMFYYFNDIITSLNKIYNIKIQNIYFGTDVGEIPGVEVFVENTLNLTYQPFNFSVAINAKDVEHLTQFDILMFLTAQDYMLTQNDVHNYSPFRRPPPLSQRNSGKLFGALGLGLLLGLAYPAYQYGYGYYMSIVTDQKTTEWRKKDAELKKINDTIKDLKEQITQTRKFFDVENKVLTERQDLLTGIFDKKVKYPMKANAIYDMSNLVNQNQGNIVRIQDIDRNLTISVRTSSDKQMTKLLKDISNVKPYAVYTRSIALNDKNSTVKFYDSNISVEISDEK